MSESEEIKARIINLINDGERDKQIIYTKVVEEFNVPRPTVRRYARDLRNEYADVIKVLQSDIPN